MLKLNMGTIPMSQSTNFKTSKKPAWHKASQEDMLCYTEELDSRMQDIIVPESVHCLDTACRDTSHSNERDSLFNLISCLNERISLL